MVSKVFVNDYGEAAFTCPLCGRSSRRDVSTYMNIDTLLKIKCKCTCGNIYSVTLERRKFVRKKIDLSGKYTAEATAKKGLIKILDLSQSGLKMSTNIEPEMDRGDRLTLEFRLDNRDRDLIRRDVVVRSIKGKEVGVEFLSDEHYDSLGKYLAFG